MKRLYSRDWEKLSRRGRCCSKRAKAGREMFVIQSGKVRISKNVRGEEQVLASLGAGEFFGEMAILNNKPRSATATVVDESKVLVIDPKTFEIMLKNNVEIAVRMIKKLAQRLQEADDQIESLLYKDANSRVVHTLTRAADAYGKAVEGGIKIATSFRGPGRENRAGTGAGEGDNRQA